MERQRRSISAQRDWIWLMSLRIRVAWSSEEPPTTAFDDDSEDDDADENSRRSSLSKASLIFRDSRLEVEYKSDRMPPPSTAIAILLEINNFLRARNSVNISSIRYRDSCEGRLWELEIWNWIVSWPPNSTQIINVLTSKTFFSFSAPHLKMSLFIISPVL